MSCFDNKCYILKNGIKTLAYGHKDIKQIKANVSIEWNQGFILLTLVNSFEFVYINVKAKVKDLLLFFIVFFIHILKSSFE